MMVGFNFAPKGWALCNGQLLAISQNQALFSILGTTYGGNGTNNFALPNLQGSFPLHWSSTFPLGGRAGEIAHTLLASEMPIHNHFPVATSATADNASPSGAFWASAGRQVYAPSTVASGLMSPSALATTGSNQPHNNMPPYLVINFVIALQGIFPSRS